MMGLESATYVGDLVATNPVASDSKGQGDDHLRLIKSTLKATFPGLGNKQWRHQSKSGNYTVVSTDNYSVFICSGTFTLTLTAAASIGTGFIFGVIAVDGVISITGDTTDGLATIVLQPGESCFVVCTGSNYWTLGRVVGQAEFAAVATAGGTMVASTFTKVPFNSETFDENATYDAATNYRWVAQKAGKVWASAFVRLTAINPDVPFLLAIYKNGSLVIQGIPSFVGTISTIGAEVSALLSVAAGDYLEIFAFNGDVSNQSLDTGLSQFSVAYV